MKIRLHLKAGFLLLMSIFLACQSAHNRFTKSAKQERPNVILIMVDDMGWSDIGCYGSEVSTPHIDKMAAEGIRFTQMYNTSKCSPSRACLLTGLYAHRTGYHNAYKKNMDNGITLGELFKIAGYTTMWSGKHHSTELPTTRGFDHYSGLFEGASNHFNPGARRSGEGQPAQKRPDRPWVIDGKLYDQYTPPKNFYTTDAFTDYALGWLDKQKADKPFFLYLAYTAPHDPLMAWPTDIAKYKGTYMEGYDMIRNKRFAKQKESGLLPKDYPISIPSYQDWKSLSNDAQEGEDLKMAVYSAMIDRLDQNIGRLLSRLEEMDAKDNTLIFFLSDNGASSEVVSHVKGSGEIGTLTRWTSLGGDWANVSNVPYRYFKNYSQEGGIKTPFIAFWPNGIKDKNRISTTPLHLIDFMSTFVELTGVEYPSRFNEQDIFPGDGISFLPILKGKEIQRHKPLYWQWRFGKAIRDGDWKLVAWKNQWSLYNLKNDPVEEHDLSDSYPDKTEKLKSMYAEWAKDFEI